MIDLPTFADLQTAVEAETRPELKKLLWDRLVDTRECGLQDLTHVLVVEADDSEDAIVAAIGFSPLVSRIDNLRNSADWDWCEQHTGWWELLYTVGNDGFAFIVLVEDDTGAPLACLCRREGPS